MSLTQELANASYNGDLKEVKRLLSIEGVDPHAEDELALRYAASKGQTRIVQLLLSLGADVDARDGYALRAAAMDGYLDTVKLLLESGADVSYVEDTALMIAWGAGFLDVAKVLLDAGAQPPAVFSEASAIDQMELGLITHEDYVRGEAKKNMTHQNIPQLEYENKSTQHINHKTNTDLELLKRLKGYLNE